MAGGFASDLAIASGSKWLRYAGETFLALMLGIVATKTILTLLVPQSLPVQFAQEQTSYLGPAIGKTIRLDLGFDPFFPNTTVSTEMAVNAPETELELELYGLRSGEGGAAIILTPDNEQNSYGVGDEIIEGVFLKAVASDHAVLSQNGRIERLTFDQSQRTTLLKDNTQPVKAANAAALLSSVVLTRVFKNGQTAGYEIQPKNSAVNLSAYGLQRGDILVQIGEEDLRRGRPDFQEISELINSSNSVTISIIRGDRPMTLSVRQ